MRNVLVKSTSKHATPVAFKFISKHVEQSESIVFDHLVTFHTVQAIVFARASTSSHLSCISNFFGVPGLVP